MNRQNFLGHLALALALVMVSAFIGQMRRMHSEHRQLRTVEPVQSASAGAWLSEEATPDAEADVLVRFRPGTSKEAIDSIAARLGDRIEDRIEFVSGLTAIDDEDGLDPEAVAEEYRALPEVEYAEPNYTIELEPEIDEDVNDGYGNTAGHGTTGRFTTTPNDPLFSDQWSLANTGQREGKTEADISALNAWAKTKGSEKVVVAVLDSGVQYTHPDLLNNMWVRPASIAAYADEHLGTIDDVHGYDGAENDGDPMDDNGHGTHCAGIIGAEGGNLLGIAGINWRVQIMPLKFMSAGGFGTTKAAIECINYVVDRKKAGVNVRIISASWGSTQKSKALEDAIRRAGDEGILFIAASGNSSQNADRSPHYPASYKLPNVISVAALNRRDELASFSNYGLKSVHVAAPGAEILSTWLNDGFEEHSGTSMATPEVAGIAALVLSVDDKLSVKELRERLIESTDKLDGLRDKIVSGGRINAARAVKGE